MCVCEIERGQRSNCDREAEEGSGVGSESSITMTEAKEGWESGEQQAAYWSGKMSMSCTKSDGW